MIQIPRPRSSGRPDPASRSAVSLLALLLSVPATGLVSIPAPASAQLSDVEERIAAHVEARRAEAVDLLERMVEVNSGTMNPAGVRRVGRVAAAELEEIGFETRWVDVPDSLRRAGHLVAVREGNGPALLLIGHLDTVFEEGSPFHDFVRRGSEAAGPGVADMKGGIVVLFEALRALDAVGALDDLTVRVVLTGDEESPGRPLEEARRALVEAARESDVALGFEGGSRDVRADYGVIARRSSSEWMLRSTGRRAHSSGVFSEDVGAGAIFEAARVLDGFYSYLRGEEFLTFNPGAILGGTEVEYDEEETRGVAFGKTNVVATDVVAHGGIRTISTEQLDRARERMREIASNSLPHTSSELTFTDGYPPMPPTAGNRRLLDVYDRASRDLGFRPVEAFDPGGRGAADISFVAPYVDGMDGLGPYGSGSHTERETVDLPSLVTQAKRAALLMYRLGREG